VAWQWHSPARRSGSAIIDESAFNKAQGQLQSRAPKRMPPRVANGPTFLAGLARAAIAAPP
jgi:hypothetical protein